MCKTHVEAFLSTNVTVIILRCRTHTRLGRKSGYFKRWLEYSNEFETLKASGKLNICSFKLGKNTLDYINSKLWRKTCCGRCSCWTLSSGTENWLNQRHPEHPEPCQFIASRNHSLVERTESKGNSTACEVRNYTHVQVHFRPYNEEHVTVRNKTFICLGSRKNCLY